MEYDSSKKNNKTTLCAGKWMEVEIIMLSEIGQTQKEKYHMFSVICEILKRKKQKGNLFWGDYQQEGGVGHERVIAAWI
jgi:hypothetical protein